MLSVVCPVFNEAEHIEGLIRFFVNSKPDAKELLIIDGGSTDGTVEKIQRWQKMNPNIRVIENPDKYVPFALNIGIKEAVGDPIIRLDAHTEYNPDYFIKILETFERTNADIVGGPMRPVGRNSFQKAVAYATSHPFGVGGSRFHFEDFEGYTDSVYLGAWKRSLFDHIGLFDEKFLRNQDDEFHYRANSKKKKVYLNPEITSFYYPRDTLSSLFRQYYQYGLYKPLVLKKIPDSIKFRHLVPALFALYLISLPICFLITLWLIPLILYFLTLLISISKANINAQIKKYLFLVFPALHIAYGMGFIIGFINLIFKMDNNIRK